MMKTTKTVNFNYTKAIYQVTRNDGKRDSR